MQPELHRLPLSPPIQRGPMLPGTVAGLRKRSPGLVRRALVPLLAPALASAAASAQSTQPAPGSPHLFCPPAIQDAATAQCVGASSLPTAGFLLPLGPELFVEPLGNVGLGTLNPGVHLDVVGGGGTASTIRALTTGTAGAGGILLQRPGGTPVNWSLSFESGAKRDFLIHDNVAAKTRLRIDANGAVSCERLEVGSATAGLQFKPFGSEVGISFGPPGTTPNPLLTATVDRLEFHRTTEFDATAELDADAVHGPFSSLYFTEDDINPSSPSMIYMFEDDTANFDRMVLSHSKAFENWGLLYQDSSDEFHFLGSGGFAVLTVSLPQRRVGIGSGAPTNILTIQQGSSTDPIADAWTTYSSRRWKENVEPLQGALELVLALRAVTFDWKASGEPDLGMIAEEVGAVLPELVAYEENGVDAQSIDYARLSAVLVGAVQEQHELLLAQAERLDAQERSLEELRGRMERLELAALR